MAKRGPYIKHNASNFIDFSAPFPVAIDPMAKYLDEALKERSEHNYKTAGSLAYAIAARHNEKFEKIRSYLRRKLKVYF